MEVVISQADVTKLEARGNNGYRIRRGASRIGLEAVLILSFRPESCYAYALRPAPMVNASAMTVFGLPVMRNPAAAISHSGSPVLGGTVFDFPVRPWACAGSWAHALTYRRWRSKRQ